MALDGDTVDHAARVEVGTPREIERWVVIALRARVTLTQALVTTGEDEDIIGVAVAIEIGAPVVTIGGAAARAPAVAAAVTGATNLAGTEIVTAVAGRAAAVDEIAIIEGGAVAEAEERSAVSQKVPCVLAVMVLSRATSKLVIQTMKNFFRLETRVSLKRILSKREPLIKL